MCLIGLIIIEVVEVSIYCWQAQNNSCTSYVQSILPNPQPLWIKNYVVKLILFYELITSY
jgi:hypothetical protein